MKNKQLTVFLMLTTAILSSCAGPSPVREESSENAVISAIMERRSIRKYQDKAVPRELLQKVAECGVHAPNAMNAQKWEVRIVDSPEYIDGVTKLFQAKYPEVAARNTYFKNVFRNAPAIICVAGDGGRFSDVNCGLMGENMMIAANALGLGTCCLGGPVGFVMREADARPYLETLQFADGYTLCYILAIGYPEESPEAKPRDLSKIRFVDFR